MKFTKHIIRAKKLVSFLFVSCFFAPILPINNNVDFLNSCPKNAFLAIQKSESEITAACALTKMLNAVTPQTQDNKNTYDVAIIGSGPAGLTAGIYTSRGQLKTIIIEGYMPGGQLTTTTYIENWPGNPKIAGCELIENMKKHAQSCGAEFLSDSVVSVNLQKTAENLFTLNTQRNKTIQAKCVIIATGASNKKLGCPGEAEYFGKGVSTCATCDAPFYRNKEIAIVGGGDSAMTEANHLSHFAKKITVIQHSQKLTGKDPIKLKVLNNPKVSILYNTNVKEICGDNQSVTHIKIENALDKTTQEMRIDGIFLAIGQKPNTGFLQNQIELDSRGYVVVHEQTKTSIDGVFCAGDVADYKYRQAIVSAGNGCQAALDAQKYLNN